MKILWTVLELSGNPETSVRIPIFSNKDSYLQCTLYIFLKCIQILNIKMCESFKVKELSIQLYTAHVH